MMTKKPFQALVLPLLALFCGLAQAQAPATVKARAVDMGENIEYQYQVTNLTKARSIGVVSIGDRGDGSDDPLTKFNEQPELSIYPTGSSWTPPLLGGDESGVVFRTGGTFTGPPGWRGGIADMSGLYPYQVNVSPKFAVGWGSDGSPRILTGQTFNFSVTVPKRSVTLLNPNVGYKKSYVPELFPMGDPAYLNGHFTVWFDYFDGLTLQTYTGLIEPAP